MNISKYNHYIEQGESCIIFNAYTVSFLIAKKRDINKFLLKKNLEELEEEQPQLFYDLCRKGMLIPDYFDEKATYISDVMDRKFSGKTYHMIINMTMDCNLRCWYCYETHIDNSVIGKDTISSIIKHIELKYDKAPFELLTLSFFGGEPLLYKEKILHLLSLINPIAGMKGFKITINFTTNATLLTKNFLDAIKGYHSTFQITLDGCRNIHNTIRKYKDKKAIGSYDRILESLSLIKEHLTDYELLLRINISPQTSVGLQSLVADIEPFFDPQKATIAVHKVWQVNEKKIDDCIINNFVKECQTRGFVCTYLDLKYKLCSCYADNLNEVVINYDSRVYKCTARKFNEANSCGFLREDGVIIWDYTKLMNRMKLQIPDQCINCDMLPVCSKRCSQSLLDDPKEFCVLKQGYSKVDYIIELLNNSIVSKKRAK